MDFWKSQPRDDDEEEAEEQRRKSEPTFIENLVDYAKEEAIGAVAGNAVEFLSGGWITYDGPELPEDDEEDDRRRPASKHESFEQRLERELKKLGQQAPDAPYEAGANPEPRSFEPVSPLLELPPVEQPVATPPAYTPASQPPAFRGPQGFGRKGL
jgi:hypothetical protein